MIHFGPIAWVLHYHVHHTVAAIFIFYLTIVLFELSNIQNVVYILAFFLKCTNKDVEHKHVQVFRKIPFEFEVKPRRYTRTTSVSAVNSEENCLINHF